MYVCIDFFLAIYYLYSFDHKLILNLSCSSSNLVVNDNETCENSTKSIELTKSDNVLSILFHLMKTFFKIDLLALFSFVVCFRDTFHKTIERELYSGLIHHIEFKSNIHSLSFNKKKNMFYMKKKKKNYANELCSIQNYEDRHSIFLLFFSSPLLMSLQPPNKRRRVEKKEDNLSTLKNKFFQLLPGAPFIISRLIVNFKLLVFLIILF